MAIKRPVTIRGRICIIFIALIIIIFIIAYSLYAWGIQKIQVQMVNNLCMQNYQCANILAKEIERITLLQYALAGDWDLIKLSLPLEDYTEYENIKMMLDIRKRIMPIKTSSRIIDEIKIIIPSTNKYISTDHIGKLTDKERQVIKDYEEVQTTIRPIVFNEEQWVITAEYPVLYYKLGQDLQYLIQTTLSEYTMSQYLDSFNTDKGGQGFLLSTQRDKIISSNYNKERAKQIAIQMAQVEPEKVYGMDKVQQGTYTQKVKVEGISYIVVYTQMHIQNIRVVKYIAEDEIFKELKKYTVIIYGLISLASLMSISFAYYVHQLIHKPIHKLMEGFEQVQNKNFKVQIEHAGEDEFKYIYGGFNEMIKQLDQYINQYYQQKLLLQDAELKQLQSQINPHFLYNSFIILSNRIREGDNVFAAHFCSELGSFFRFITRNKCPITLLKEEVEHAYNYCHIQYARFSHRMTMELEALPEVYEAIQIPRLILQPIIENAFKYAIEVTDGEGFLHISYNQVDEFIEIWVEDNGDELTDTKLLQMQQLLIEQVDGEITGIVNIHRRLQLSYCEACGLKFERSEYGGLKVVIKIRREGVKHGTTIDCR